MRSQREEEEGVLAPGSGTHGRGGRRRGGGRGAAASTQQGFCSTLSWPSSSKSEEELTEAEERWVGALGPSAEFSLKHTVSSVPFLLGYPGTPF